MDGKAPVPGQIISRRETLDLERAFILKRGSTLLSSSSDPFAEQLQIQHSKAKQKSVKERFTVQHQATKPLSDRSDAANKGDRAASQKFKESDAPFSLLPDDKLPEPTKRRVDEGGNIGDEDLVISPDPLPEPILPPNTGNNISTGLSMPKSSSVPSYILAMANRLSPEALERAITSQRLDAKPPPLFVYGSLMLPSVLRTRAAKFTLTEGVYSRRLQRRLRTSAEDWANVNESLQQAAQQMTPALLKGYHRVEIGKYKDAALLRPKIRFVSQGNAPSKRINPTRPAEVKTHDFIVFGLSHEAFACLNFLFSYKTDKIPAQPEPSSNSDSDCGRGIAINSDTTD